MTSSRRDLRRSRATFWLAVILLAAAVYRFAGLNWDQGQHLHPDERFLVMVASAVRWPEPAGLYFDESRSPLNPRNAGYASFAYGTLPVTVLKAVSRITGRGDFDFLTLAGRTMSALFDLVTVLLVFQLGLALKLGRRTALLAALFYAGAVCAIQQAHFFVVDPAANCFLAAALVFTARYRSSGRLRDCLAAGGCLGLALACKISAAMFLPVALLVFLDRSRGAAAAGEKVWWCQQELRAAVVHFALFALAALAVFRLAEPTAFHSADLWNALPSERWLANVRDSARLAAGLTDIPPGHQWTGRIKLWFPWINMVVWGMGIPLGLAAWAGWFAAARRIGTGRSPRLLLPVSWIGLVFLYQGTQWAMTLRYFLPVYGSLCVLAAWATVRWGRMAGPKARYLAPAVALFTLCWASAFTFIYLQPHTRIQGSEWIYRHIDPGRALAYEYWDDALPLRLPGRTPEAYRSVEMRWYDEDTPGKLRQALDWLDSSDYVILSSNRLSDSIPRLPARYPMTTRYYRALFDGSLGFEKAAEFRSWMGEAGEEAFSVFDHPVVRIFRKTSRYDRARAEAFLGAVDWHDLVPAAARDGAGAPTGLMLPERSGRPPSAAQTFDEMFPAGAVGARFPLAVWLAVVFALGWMAAPLLFFACPALADRGYGFGKTLGILLAAWIAWLIAATGIARFESPWIWAAAAAVSAIGVSLVASNRREFLLFLRRRWRLLLASDAVFLAAFAVMAAVRVNNPDLWHPFFGGEKPMDFAYLNAIVRGGEFPPHNPWFAGGFINYYYFGFVLVAALLKGCGIPPEVGYNLAIPTFFALAASGLYSLTHALLPASQTPRARSLLALAGPMFVLVMGNLKQVVLVAARLGGADVPAGKWYFDASRAIAAAPGEATPITEFPFFTFLYGDLHAHAIALPLFVMALGLSASLAVTTSAGRSRWTALALAALTCGALWASNPWDLPAAALLLAAALWMSSARKSWAAAEWTAAIGAGYLAFLPFHRWFAPAYGSFEIWRGSQTRLADYLAVYGVVLFAIALGAGLPAAPRRRTTLIALAGCAAWIAAGAPAWPVPALLGWYVLVQRRDESASGRFAALLAAGGLALTLIVELAVLHGDVGRMNTTFKFGFQAWTLLGVAAALAAARWCGRAPASTSRWAPAAVLAVLVAAALTYPLTAPYFRSRDRFDPALGPSWNGMDFLATARHSQCGRTFPLAGDRDLIRWLRANASGAPVIAEANTAPVLYGWGSRISVYTGLPTIAGWDWHLRQQMGAHDSGRVGRRIADIQEIYGTGDARRAWELLRRYKVEFAVVGELERACASDAGIAKFSAGQGRYWNLAFRSGAASIYRVEPSPR